MRSFEFDEVRRCCLSKRHVSESFPFDNYTMVWKVAGKVFAIANIDHFSGVSLKCDPEWAIELRELYEAVSPGFHLNKKHWNTISAELDVTENLLEEFIAHSYACVVQGMTKKSRMAYGL
jgi:predicted DNA-binding protein (MmcQ/YjbR family)